MEGKGLGPEQIGHMLELLAEQRRGSQQLSDRLELVWSGPELAGSRSRDTGVIVRELFRAAKSSVLLSSYAVDSKDKSRALFRPLAENMDGKPALRVQMFVNVQRRKQDGDDEEAAIVGRFAERFGAHLWSGERLPEVFYDPRSLDPGRDQRACHAKCVVVDGERALVTSANFTEAAHARNIEAGVLIADPMTATDLRTQFEALVQSGALRRVPGME